MWYGSNYGCKKVLYLWPLVMKMADEKLVSVEEKEGNLKQIF
jgi:hypothetical protein